MPRPEGQPRRIRRAVVAAAAVAEVLMPSSTAKADLRATTVPVGITTNAPALETPPPSFFKTGVERAAAPEEISTFADIINKFLNTDGDPYFAKMEAALMSGNTNGFTVSRFGTDLEDISFRPNTGTNAEVGKITVSTMQIDNVRRETSITLNCVEGLNASGLNHSLPETQGYINDLYRPFAGGDAVWSSPWPFGSPQTIGNVTKGEGNSVRHYSADISWQSGSATLTANLPL